METQLLTHLKQRLLLWTETLQAFREHLNIAYLEKSRRGKNTRKYLNRNKIIYGIHLTKRV